MGLLGSESHGNKHDCFEEMLVAFSAIAECAKL